MRVLKSPTPAPPSLPRSRIEALPYELLFCISDFLPTPDIFSLSYTSTRLLPLHTTRCPKTITPEDRRAIFVHLARDYPPLAKRRISFLHHEHLCLGCHSFYPVRGIHLGRGIGLGLPPRGLIAFSNTGLVFSIVGGMPLISRGFYRWTFVRSTSPVDFPGSLSDWPPQAVWWNLKERDQTRLCDRKSHIEVLARPQTLGSLKIWFLGRRPFGDLGHATYAIVLCVPK